MSVFVLAKNSYEFPPVDMADNDGLLAIGGDLNPQRVLNGYRNGIFPWFSFSPIKWYSPDPRMVLFVDEFHYSRSLAKTIHAAKFTIKYDHDFQQVISQCRATRYNVGTWITPEMLESYCKLHELGYAHSVEVYQGADLVGGLYGVLLNGIFFGESMFHRVNDASKVAMVFLIEKLRQLQITIIDSQVYTENIARFGGRLISRENYLKILKESLQQQELIGQWK